MSKSTEIRDKQELTDISFDMSFGHSFQFDACSADACIAHDDEAIPCGPLFAPCFADLNNEERHELWAALALRHTVGLGPRAHGKLLEHFGSALHAVQAACASKSSLNEAWETTGIPKSKARSIANGAWRTSAYKEWQSLMHSDVGILLWTNPHYPALLRVIIDPPLFLYCKGDISLLANATISVVGSRLCSREGQKVAKTISKELSRVGITVVSGMAKGVDSLAHSAALEGVGASIGVLGTGLDIRYPIENKKLFIEMESKGLLVTEYALGTPARAKNFPARNRIVSGLSLGVVVIEAAARSGSLITARLALEQGHEVYAVPGPSSLQQCRGCHELIRQGAYPVFEAEDILRDLASPLRLRSLETPQRQRLQKRVAQRVAHTEKKKSKMQMAEGASIASMHDSGIRPEPMLAAQPSIELAPRISPKPSVIPEKPMAEESFTQDLACSASEVPCDSVFVPPALLSDDSAPSVVENEAADCDEESILTALLSGEPVAHQANIRLAPQEDIARHSHAYDGGNDGSNDESDDGAERLMKLLENGEELDMDTLALAAGMDAAKASTLLFVLEMSGKVRRLQGSRFMKVMPKRGDRG